MEQYILTNLHLTRLPSRAHTGDTRSWRTNRIIAAPNPYIFHRTRECPALGNEDKSTPANETESPIKGISGRAAGPEVPYPCINTRATELHNIFCQACRRLPGEREPTMNLDGDVATSNSSLWVEIKQGLWKVPTLWDRPDTQDPQACAGVHTLL